MRKTAAEAANPTTTLIFRKEFAGHGSQMRSDRDAACGACQSAFPTPTLNHHTQKFQQPGKEPKR